MQLIWNWSPLRLAPVENWIRVWRHSTTSITRNDLFLSFSLNFMFWMVCLLPCVCADWEGTAFFPSRLFHAVFSGTHNLLYFHSFASDIQVCFLRELPASPRLFSFLITKRQWWFPEKNPSGVEMPRWARVSCTGEVHAPFCWDFQAVSCQLASSLLLCEALSSRSSVKAFHHH